MKIPFYPRFKEPLLNGIKTWTSRTKWYGKVGDTFDAFGHEFEIIERMMKPLFFVVEHWREEGCESKHDFKEVWRKIHPIKGYYPSWIVKVHVFRRIS